MNYDRKKAAKQWLLNVLGTRYKVNPYYKIYGTKLSDITLKLEIKIAKMSQHNRNTQSGSLNLGVKCGIEFDERVELLSSIFILSEICMVKTKGKKKNISTF